MSRWLADNEKISHKEESTFTLRCIGSLLYFFFYSGGMLSIWESIIQY